MSERPTCELCGHPMPEGEEMFKFHGYSGPCPGPRTKPMGGVPEVIELHGEKWVRIDVVRKLEEQLADAEAAIANHNCHLVHTPCGACGIEISIHGTCGCEDIKHPVGQMELTVRQRLAAAEAHELQTHERLGAILGTDTSLEEAAKRMVERLAAADALWETAVQFEGQDWADHIAQSLEAEKVGLQ